MGHSAVVRHEYDTSAVLVNSKTDTTTKDMYWMVCVVVQNSPMFAMG